MLNSLMYCITSTISSTRHSVVLCGTAFIECRGISAQPVLPSPSCAAALYMAAIPYKAHTHLAANYQWVIYKRAYCKASAGLLATYKSSEKVISQSVGLVSMETTSTVYPKYSLGCTSVMLSTSHSSKHT